VQAAQQQHKDDFVAGKTGNGGDAKAGQAGAHGGPGIFEAEQPVAGEADKKCNAKAHGVGQFGPHPALRQGKNKHVREGGAGPHQQKPEA